MRICPKCGSEKIVQEPASPADLYGGKIDKYRCEECGYSGTFFPDKTKMLRAHLIITGRVQGVFFRDSTKKIADKLNLTGFVKNLYNTNIEIVFEGLARCILLTGTPVKQVITYPSETYVLIGNGNIKTSIDAEGDLSLLSLEDGT